MIEGVGGALPVGRHAIVRRQNGDRVLLAIEAVVDVPVVIGFLFAFGRGIDLHAFSTTANSPPRLLKFTNSHLSMRLGSHHRAGCWIRGAWRWSGTPLSVSGRADR